MVQAYLAQEAHLGNLHCSAVPHVEERISKIGVGLGSQYFECLMCSPALSLLIEIHYRKRTRSGPTPRKALVDGIPLVVLEQPWHVAAVVAVVVAGPVRMMTGPAAFELEAGFATEQQCCWQHNRMQTVRATFRGSARH